MPHRPPACSIDEQSYQQDKHYTKGRINAAILLRRKWQQLLCNSEESA
jgi:hypothetical protein